MNETPKALNDIRKILDETEFAKTTVFILFIWLDGESREIQGVYDSHEAADIYSDRWPNTYKKEIEEWEVKTRGVFEIKDVKVKIVLVDGTVQDAYVLSINEDGAKLQTECDDGYCCFYVDRNGKFPNSRMFDSSVYIHDDDMNKFRELFHA